MERKGKKRRKGKEKYERENGGSFPFSSTKPCFFTLGLVGSVSNNSLGSSRPIPKAFSQV